MDSEKHLIAQLQDTQTQDKAFRNLMGLYKERLYWHIRNIVKSHDDADDVLQNTFIKVYKNISNFKGDSKLYSWMYRIATNESITHLNKRAKQQQVSLEDIQIQLADSLHADNYFSGDEIQEKLQKALVLLPTKQQLVFNMKYFDNMKYNDISDILGTSVGALKASYHHAVKKIEHYLTNS
ncbi:MAG: RNA polymerase sigma factor [Flavobacteriaceae bacterium]|nr:RNA polymerase sigma factor [Flavobacteriaceae bacterium]